MFRALLRVLIMALVLVFGVLLAEFRNFFAPIALLSASVLSISGVVLALFVTRTEFNVARFMGLIMVIGIVAKNGILLLDADEKFRAHASSDQQQLELPHPSQSHRDGWEMTTKPSPATWPARQCCTPPSAAFAPS